MNLQHLEAADAIVRHRFNISAAAVSLGSSQPTLSRQIQQLERELGVRLFVRTRNKVVALTAKGEEIVRIGRRMLLDAQALARVARSHAEGPNELTIATTHLHARYSLPQVMKVFAARHPDAVLTLRQGDPTQCCELVAAGVADIGITTTGASLPAEIVALPAFRLSRCVIAPRGHPIARAQPLTLKGLAAYPMIAYSMPFSGRWIVEEAFARAGLRPRIVCSAIDADVSKTYVELGMGIAVLARIAYDPVRDRTLVARDASHLFQPSVVNLIVRRYGYMSRYGAEFVSLFAPHLGAERVRRAMEGDAPDAARLTREAPVAPAG